MAVSASISVTIPSAMACSRSPFDKMIIEASITPSLVIAEATAVVEVCIGTSAVAELSMVVVGRAATGSVAAGASAELVGLLSLMVSEVMLAHPLTAIAAMMRAVVSRRRIGTPSVMSLAGFGASPSGVVDSVRNMVLDLSRTVESAKVVEILRFDDSLFDQLVDRGANVIEEFFVDQMDRYARRYQSIDYSLGVRVPRRGVRRRRGWYSHQRGSC